MDKYHKLNINIVVQNFLKHYNTRGNMRLLTETFQRNLVKQQFIKWYYYYAKAFVNPPFKAIEIGKEPGEEPEKEPEKEPIN
jgi:hypothetical protein